jgi:hypothetical protein
VATLSYAYADSIVWLEELAPEAHPMVHDLCRLHASTIRVPLGWVLQDRWSVDDARVTSPGLFDGERFDLVGA